MSYQSLLFSADGVPVDLVRTGEPRLRRSSRRRTSAQQAPSASRRPALGRVGRLLPS